MKSLSSPLLYGTALLAALALVAESPAQQRAQQQKQNNQKQQKDKGAKDKGAKDKAAQEQKKAQQAGMKFEEAEVLKQAYLLLLMSNHEYKQHRGKALHAVKEAFKALDAQVQKGGTPQQKAALAQEAAAIAQAEKADKGAAKLHEPQPTSDAQFLRAKNLLGQVGGALAKNNQKPVLKHVEEAVKHIDAALQLSAAAKTKVGVQFAEAELLRKAYVLILETDADYKGAHREKALHAVKSAFGALDAHVAKNGTPQQQAVMVQENATIAAAEKARKNAGAIQEAQLVSNAYLAGAKEVLAELRPLLVNSKQNKILDHVDTAGKEIDGALSNR